MGARRPERILFGVASLAVAIAAASAHAAGAGRPAVAEADLAGSVADALAERTVTVPDGGRSAVLSESRDDAPLDPTRLITCLETVSEADAWPDAWVVVQDASRSWDLVMHVALAQDGRSVEIDTTVAAPRRTWDHDAIRDAVRDATGRKPKVRNVVVQAFRERTTTTFVYRTGLRERRGLMALLPEDTILREARSVDLGDGRRHTLAVVLVAPTFEPADCSTPAGRAVGHVDRGTVRIVLAGEQAIEATADLGEGLGLPPGSPVAVPRFSCRADDPAGIPPDATIADWLKTRTPLPMLEPEGEPLTFAVPVLDGEGGTIREIRIVIDPSGPSIRVAR